MLGLLCHHGNLLFLALLHCLSWQLLISPPPPPPPPPLSLSLYQPLWKPPPVVKKSGYLRKMDPKPKRLWFVLNGTELKYYRNKESFFKPNRAKATVSLESWCKLSRLSGGSSFEVGLRLVCLGLEQVNSGTISCCLFTRPHISLCLGPGGQSIFGSNLSVCQSGAS